MVYECEECEAPLGPGWMACPRCGQRFDEPVPDDAILPDDEALEESQPVCPPETSLFPPVLDLPPRPHSPRRARLPRVAARLLGILALLSLAWLGVRFSALLMPFAPPPIVSVLPAPLSDLRAHPAYAADMSAFVEKLRESGVSAQWPAFGSNDTLLITPPTLVGGPRAVWNADLYKQFAQGTYGSFWEKRYETGFSDSDSTTCFVLVCDASGKIVAADLMGNVE